MTSRKLTLRERLYSKTAKVGDCLIWTAGANVRGYGQIKINGRMRLATRIAWELDNGPLPSYIQLDHIKCPAACINPRHLRPVTHAQNQQNQTGAYRNNRTGVRGVTQTKYGTFRADAKLNGVAHYLGCYPTLAEADQVVTSWRREHMPFSERDRLTATTTTPKGNAA